MQPTLFLARSVALAVTSDGSVQMFPPGVTKLTPSRLDGGEAEEIELTIDEATAELLEVLRADLQAKATASEGDAPFFDFNHEDGAAAAWPKKIYWAGSDPQTGGVRAQVEWSSAGDAAVQGRTFRRFSPAFHAEGGRITGAPVNMGGLVNRAAFSRIQPLFAKDPDTKPTKPTMNEDQIKALQEENANLKTQLAELQGQLDAMTKSDAEATVAQAAKDGRIPAAPEMQAKWVASIVRDPSAKELLLAMAPNKALGSTSIVQGKAPEPGEEETPETLLAKFNELPREEQPAFYRAHKAALRRTKY